jgi:hypothetical protein
MIGWANTVTLNSATQRFWNYSLPMRKAGVFISPSTSKAGNRARRIASLPHWQRMAWVRVFVTTNFDRLRERALAEHGITPIVVTSDDDLRRATQREQAACYALKPHGDYLQQTVRNSPDELARIDPGLEVEKQEVFDRFGVVILGYSRSDKALGGILRGRESGGGNERKRRLAVRGGLHADLLDPGERPFGRDHGHGHDREPRRRRLRGLERPAGLLPAGCERGRRCRDVGWHLRLHRNGRYGQRRPARAGPAPAFTIAFGKGVEKA